MSPQTAGYILCGVFIAVAFISALCKRDHEHPLPKPHDDTRDWQGAFMKDWKR